jgi:integrase
MALTLYRRHTKSCCKGYDQNERTYEPRSKREQNADCECPIVVSGSLRLESRRILHVTTETNRWDKAKRTGAQWEAWEALTDPNPATTEPNLTFEYAAGKFLEDLGPSGKNVTRGVIQQYRVMFFARMQPYLASKRTNFLAAFGDPAFSRECFLSFKNVNPTRNRKAQSNVEKPLGDTTKRAELERYRAFFRFCVENGWLNHNHATKIKLGKLKTAKKYGLLPPEEERVFDVIELVTNRGQLDRFNSKELRALCLVMRHAGLRISDAVALDDTQLVTRESGSGYAIEIESQQKTGEWVRIPITRETAEALLALPFKSSKNGKQFWFYTGNGERDTAVNNWRNRLTRLFHEAQDPDPESGEYRKPFAHHASSHTWRHTFSICHLNAGTDIKMVSRWLGHSSIAITERHYAHANRSTNVASEQAYDESVRRQKEVRVGPRPEPTLSSRGKKVVNVA